MVKQYAEKTWAIAIKTKFIIMCEKNIPKIMQG